MLYWTEKKQEEIFNGETYTVANKLPVSTEVNQNDLPEQLVAEIKQVKGVSNLDHTSLYYINKGSSEGQISYSSNHKYIIDMDTLQIYDFEGEVFRGKRHYTLNGLGVDDKSGGNSGNSGNSNHDTTISNSTPEVYMDGDIGWLKPDLNGFNSNFTDIIYFNKNNDIETKVVSIQNYINDGRKSVIEENGKTYAFDAYKDKMWANVKTKANGVECWWVWIPRYAYRIVNSNPSQSDVDMPIDTVFINMQNQPIGSKYEGKYTVNNDGTITIDGETYIIHPCFTKENSNGNTVQLQGIWMSKFDVSSLKNADIMLDSGECLAPDMSGFDDEYTWIELYDRTTENFIDDTNYKLSDVNLNTINNGKQWYDYSNKIWANVKTKANNLECWWVWIPRYAYYISEGNQETDVIFVDLQNKPCDTSTYGNNLPAGFTVHPCFTKVDENGNTVQLQGIWMSKFDASNN